MTSFRTLKTFARAANQAETFDGNVDGCVLASVETALDIVPVADGAVLASASRDAKSVHDALGGGDEAVRSSPAYLAGRMATLADLLGLAAQRCVAPDFAALLRQEKYADLLRLLTGTRLRNVDLASRTGTDAASICRKLAELKAMGAVRSSRAGRDVYNALSPAAEAVVGAGPGLRRTPDERLFDDVRQRGGGRSEGPPMISATSERATCGADA